MPSENSDRRFVPRTTTGTQSTQAEASDFGTYIEKLAELQIQAKAGNDRTTDAYTGSKQVLDHLQTHADSLTSTLGLDSTDLFDDTAIKNLARVLSDVNVPLVSRRLLLETVDTLVPRKAGIKYPTFDMLYSAKGRAKDSLDEASEVGTVAYVAYQTRCDELLKEGKIVEGVCTDPVEAEILESLLQTAQAAGVEDMNEADLRLTVLKQALDFLLTQGQYRGYRLRIAR